MNVSRYLTVVPVNVAVKRPDAPTFVPLRVRGTSGPMFSAALNLTGRGVVPDASVAASRAPAPRSVAGMMPFAVSPFFASFHRSAR